MSIFERTPGTLGRDWRLKLGPFSFARLQAGEPKITQLTLGSLWITHCSSSEWAGKASAPNLTVNWGHYMVFHGPVMVDRRTHAFY